MTKISSDIKNQISLLSKKELETIVFKLAAKEKVVYNYLLVNYIDKDTGENDLFEQTKSALDLLFLKSYKGFSEQLQLANMLSACTKCISDFSKACKNKKLETDLLVHVLEYIFSLSTNFFNTCFTAYDYKVALMLKRVITLIENKLHPDFKIEYSEKINMYLKILHRTSNHINAVNSLPQQI